MKINPFAALASTAILIFACGAMPALANRGGGGGGSHGGGGGGGSFHSSGGGFHGGGARLAGGSFRGGASSPPVAGYASRSGGSASHSFGPPAGARGYGNVNSAPRPSSFSSAPRTSADGNWHSFGGESAGRAATSPQSNARGSARMGGGWQVFGGNRSAASGVARSFSGQGGEVWETTPAARNVVSPARTLSNVRESFANAAGGNASGRASTSPFVGSRFAGAAPLGNRAVAGSQFSNNFAGSGFRGRGWYGNSFYGYRGGFGGRCWNCGLGFGYGWGPGWGFGFGWPWYGFGGLYWSDPWWGWPGYGYYGNPIGYLYGGPYSGYYSDPYIDPTAQVNDGNDPNAQYPQSYSDSNSPPAAPSADQDAPNQGSTQSSVAATAAVPILLYMKDGSVYAARDYWISNGQLQYVLLSGTSGAIDADRLDMQRSIVENARSGVTFTLKNQ